MTAEAIRTKSRLVTARVVIASVCLSLAFAAPARPSAHVRAAVRIGTAAHLTDRDVLA